MFRHDPMITEAERNLGFTYLVRQGYDGLKVDVILLLLVVLVLRMGALHALIVLPGFQIGLLSVKNISEKCF